MEFALALGNLVLGLSSFFPFNGEAKKSQHYLVAPNLSWAGRDHFAECNIVVVTVFSKETKKKSPGNYNFAEHRGNLRTNDI